MSNLQIKQPVIIVGAPRSGTSLLLTVLSKSPHLWSQYRETIDVWEKFYSFSGKRFENDLLTEKDLNELSKTYLIQEFHKHTINNYYLGYFIREFCLNKPTLLDFIGIENLIFKKLYLKEYRMVEKSPKTCFRIPFINELFPDCKFIFLKRDGRTNINSLIEGWKGPSRYKRKEIENIKLNIKNCPNTSWKFILPPEWEAFKESSVEEVSAFQWVESNETAIKSLKTIEDKRKYFLKYEDLVEKPTETINNLCNFIDIPFCNGLQKISKNLPSVNYVTKPDKDKWKKNIDLIENVYKTIEPTMKEMGYSLY